MKNKVNYAQAAKCYIFYHTPLRKGNSKKKKQNPEKWNRNHLRCTLVVERNLN